MTTISAASDNIRLIRRKIVIAEREVEDVPQGSQRDASVIWLVHLTRELVRALHDFEEMGFEDIVAEQLSASSNMFAQVRRH
jgi:hypothetical protein